MYSDFYGLYLYHLSDMRSSQWCLWSAYKPHEAGVSSQFGNMHEQPDGVPVPAHTKESFLLLYVPTHSSAGPEWINIPRCISVGGCWMVLRFGSAAVSPSWCPRQSVAEAQGWQRMSDNCSAELCLLQSRLPHRNSHREDSVTGNGWQDDFQSRAFSSGFGLCN